MTIRLHILAAITALAGHLVGVVGLPLPSTAAPESASTIAETTKTKRTCRCACSGGCGTTCCCCSETAAPAEELADSPTKRDASWHWVASIQMQKCRGIGPAGTPDLPLGLPIKQTVSHVHFVLNVDSVQLSPVTAIAVFGRPPTPPPRTA